MIDPALLWLATAAFAAGTVDSMVGGGGLIQLPVLLTVLPGVAPATLLGTSKLAGFSGTASAAAHYLRRVRLPLGLLCAGIVLALAGALGGAMLVSRIDPTAFRPLVPILLATVLALTLHQRDLGRVHAPAQHSGSEHWPGAAGIASIAVYDGFFGPGTGSFFMLFLMRRYGFDFLHAAAAARALNVATNVAALAWFIAGGHILWETGLVMAVANIAGSQVGTRLALRRGVGFVRTVFLVVVGVLVLRTGWDAARPYWH